jgi:hypothetical protein
VKTNFGPTPTGQNILREIGRESNKASSKKLTRNADLEVAAKRGARGHAFSWVESNSRNPNITIRKIICKTVVLTSITTYSKKKNLSPPKIIMCQPVSLINDPGQIKLSSTRPMVPKI